MPQNHEQIITEALAKGNEDVTFGNNFHFVVQGYAQLCGSTSLPSSEILEQASKPDEYYRTREYTNWKIRYAAENLSSRSAGLQSLIKLIRIVKLEGFTQFSVQHREGLLRAADLMSLKSHSPAETAELNTLLQGFAVSLIREYELSLEEVLSLYQ